MTHENETSDHDDGRNARIGWGVAFVVALIAIWSLLSDPSIWGVFSLVLVAVIAIPAVVTGRWSMMAPWPLLVVAAITTTARIRGVYPEPAGYIAIASLALLIVVELDAFTSVQLSRRFAVGFAVLTTMAIEALWIIVQYVSDMWLETNYLTTQTGLQWDIVTVTLTSSAIGLVFYWYVTRFEPTGLTNDSSNPVTLE